ncbi:MAG: YraN family protein [Oscillospiraceae bacterium]|nr:YraN family protein [Oscillospiraceae bacterium]
MDARQRGKAGEQEACVFLRRAGYRIVETNYFCKMGEIDIVAEKGDYIVFAEVKLRKSDRFGTAGEFVSLSKQRKIISTAMLYLSQHPTEKQPRFDVIEIYAPEDVSRSNISINHIENAFE